MASTIRVGQLSDTHFLEPGHAPEGGHAYDTSEAFEAVLGHIEEAAPLDLMVVTGDIADHGRAEQYDIARAAFERIDVQVNVCPGNHDFDAPFRAGLPTDGVTAERVIEVANWAFLFVDSNAGQMVPDDDGKLIDPPGEHRLHANGLLGEQEAQWVRDRCASVTAEHIFVWLHHPPAVPVGMFDNDPYDAEWHALLGDLPQLRGLGGGHTHIPAQYEVAGRPVIVAPSFKNNFDLDGDTWLPPGYRTYDFAEDGTVTSDVHLIDDERWPRRPLGRALRSLFAGDLTFEELADIVARRQRQAGH